MAPIVVSMFAKILQIITQIHDYPMLAFAVAAAVIVAYGVQHYMSHHPAGQDHDYRYYNGITGVTLDWTTFPSNLEWDVFQRQFSHSVRLETGKGTNPRQNSPAFQHYRRFDVAR